MQTHNVWRCSGCSLESPIQTSVSVCTCQSKSLPYLTFILRTYIHIPQTSPGYAGKAKQPDLRTRLVWVLALALDGWEARQVPLYGCSPGFSRCVSVASQDRDSRGRWEPACTPPILAMHRKRGPAMKKTLGVCLQWLAPGHQYLVGQWWCYSAPLPCRHWSFHLKCSRPLFTFSPCAVPHHP